MNDDNYSKNIEMQNKKAFCPNNRRSRTALCLA